MILDTQRMISSLAHGNNILKYLQLQHTTIIGSCGRYCKFIWALKIDLSIDARSRLHWNTGPPWAKSQTHAWCIWTWITVAKLLGEFLPLKTRKLSTWFQMVLPANTQKKCKNHSRGRTSRKGTISFLPASPILRSIRRVSKFTLKLNPSDPLLSDLLWIFPLPNPAASQGFSSVKIILHQAPCRQQMSLPARNHRNITAPSGNLTRQCIFSMRESRNTIHKQGPRR